MAYKPRKLTKAEVLDEVDTLIEGCKQGISGEWDCSTEEGRESFNPMIDSLENIKSYIKGKNAPYPPYVPKK